MILKYVNWIYRSGIANLLGQGVHVFNPHTVETGLLGLVPFHVFSFHSKQSTKLKYSFWYIIKYNNDLYCIVTNIPVTNAENHVPWQTPDIHSENVPLHSALGPHLHVPDSQLSDVWVEHIGFTPHIQIWVLHLSDSPVHSSFSEHAKILVISKI